MPSSELSTTSSTSGTLSSKDLDTEQQAAIDRFYEGDCVVIAQAGAGKTVCAQTAIEELLLTDEMERCIIFAPPRVVSETWASEWEKWEHLSPVQVIDGPPGRRQEQLANDYPICVMSLELMPWFFTTYKHDHGFDGILIDEGSKLKTAGSKGFKKLRHYIKDFKWRCAMSATPVHEGADDLYTQLFIATAGKFARSKDVFMRKYFMQVDFKGYQWEFQPGGRERLIEDAGPHLYVMNTTEYEASLPHVETVLVPVGLSKYTWSVYDRLCTKREYVNELQSVEVANNAVLQGKLQQVCCGAVYDAESEPLWLHYRKYSALDLLLKELQGPVIVVYQFDFDLDYLCHRYPEAVVYAEEKDAKARWNAGTIDILLLHPKSAGHGINLQFGGCRMVWLSPTWSADAWDQTLRRVWRRGQPSDTVWRYVLTVQKSVEELMLNRLENKMGRAQEFTDHVEEHIA